MINLQLPTVGHMKSKFRKSDLNSNPGKFFRSLKELLLSNHAANYALFTGTSSPGKQGVRVGICRVFDSLKKKY